MEVSEFLAKHDAKLRLDIATGKYPTSDRFMALNQKQYLFAPIYVERHRDQSEISG